MRKSILFISITLLFCVFTITGCARQEEPPENLRLIAALRTAVSAQNAKWLADTKASMEETIAKNEMSDETAKSFKAAIEAAEAGDWGYAEKLAIKLQESRRPASNAASHSHNHSH